MTDPDALQKHRRHLLEQIAKASDEISRIDDKLRDLMEGRKPGARS